MTNLREGILLLFRIHCVLNPDTSIIYELSTLDISITKKVICYNTECQHTLDT